MHKNLCTTAVVLLHCASPCSAQEPTPDLEQPPSPATEEIIVTGERSPAILRKEVLEAEVTLYDVFNRINKDDEFDIHCRAVASTGTRIRHHVCAPNYYHEATATEGAAMLRDMQGVSTARLDPPAAATIAYKESILQQKMREAILANPELLEAIRKLHSLKTELDESR